MAHRGGKGPDPFSQKRNRFDRFAQMSKQEEMIQQKKREIQAKLEAQKRKEAEDALKKLAASNLNKSGPKKPLSKSSASSSGRSREVKPSSPAASGPLNIFSNDGSFMDQFRKLSGVKDGKQSNASRRDEKRASSSSDSGQQSESSRDRDHRDSYRDRERDSRDYHDDRYRNDRRHDRRHDRLSNRSSQNYDRRSWEGDERQSKPWHTNDLPRPSSPYSPTLSPPPAIQDVPFPFPPPSMNLPPPLTLPQQQLLVPPQFSQPPPNQFRPFNPAVPPIPQPLTSVPPPQMNLLLSQPPSVPPPPSLETHLVPPPPAPPSLVPGLLPPHLVQQLTAVTSQYSAVNPQYSLPQFPPPPAVLSVPPPGSNPTDVKPLVSTEAGSAVVGIPVAPPTTSVFCPVLKSEPQDGAISAAVPIGPIMSTEPERLGQETQDETIRQLAQMVSQCGDDIEDIIKSRNPDDFKLWFLHQKDSEQYKAYRRLVAMFREKCDHGHNDNEKKDVIKGLKREIDDNHRPSGNGFIKTEPMDSRDTRQGNDGKDSVPSNTRKRVRRSRWDPEDTKVTPPATTAPPTIPPVLPPTNIPPPVLPSANILPPVATAPIAVLPTGAAPLLSRVNRTDPALLRYAIQAFGTSNLSDEDWKKAEDHYKINLLYQDMLKKRAELEKLQQQGKFKYEYDSDEETEGGTWEHRLRAAEMEATERWADELTKKAEGKHHIGDFLPPDELERFMEKYSALREDREPDLSDYKEFKLKEDNIGFQMLQKLGWTEGQGLGADGSGIVDPVNKATNRLDNQGLGLDRPDEVAKGDDEFEAYRKRMMLAYRFRPNPLNNPRRPYY